MTLPNFREWFKAQAEHHLLQHKLGILKGYMRALEDIREVLLARPITAGEAERGIAQLQLEVNRLTREAQKNS